MFWLQAWTSRVYQNANTPLFSFLASLACFTRAQMLNLPFSEPWRSCGNSMIIFFNSGHVIYLFTFVFHSPVSRPILSWSWQCRRKDSTAMHHNGMTNKGMFGTYVRQALKPWEYILYDKFLLENPGSKSNYSTHNQEDNNQNIFKSWLWLFTCHWQAFINYIRTNVQEHTKVEICLPTTCKDVDYHT